MLVCLPTDRVVWDGWYENLRVYFSLYVQVTGRYVCQQTDIDSKLLLLLYF